ncbi:Retrovirus-related Pol polyprotein from transposon opus, partial [Mucuna pruriens]
MCDASNFTLRAVLGQRVGKQPYVISYASQTMDVAQVNYTTIEKELLAIVLALENIEVHLEEARCKAKTDLKATMDQCKQPGKSLTVGYTSPPSSKTCIGSSEPARSARKLEWL